MSSLSINTQAALVMLGGPSGVGKTTTIDTLIAVYPKTYGRPVSFTTRPPRDTESGDSKEYEFVSRARIEELYQQGALVTLDEAYGDFYGMSRVSIDKLINQRIIPIKEIHPKNFPAVRMVLPDSVSVLMEFARVDLRDCAHRRTHDRDGLDKEFYAKQQAANFDLIHKVTVGDVSDTARGLHQALHCFFSLRSLYPPPGEIDRINRSGYDRIAAEFDDTLRLTTRDFHTISVDFFQHAIDGYITDASECLEIGPGNNWLRSATKWPQTNYYSVDISVEMNSAGPEGHERATSVRCLPYRSGQFDVALASLADPILFPTAVSEVCRVLRRGGYFILTFPTHTWSSAVRTSVCPNKTVFKLRNNDEVYVYSFTPPVDHACGLFALCGFSVVEHVVLNGSKLGVNEDIAPAISNAATSLGIPVDQLPIVDGFVLRRRM